MCIHQLRVYDVFFLRYNHYLLTFLYTRWYVFIMTLQFVVPGETEADSSPVHVSLIDVPYPYWPNRTVDWNFSQNIRACLHTAVSGVTEAWLRIDLQTVKSIKSVKVWYRNDSKYISWKTYFSLYFFTFWKCFANNKPMLIFSNATN